MKRGFTLIELLAVIVILAIIALIAVPIVINIINDSKKESLQRSIDLYIDTVEKTMTKYQMTHLEFKPNTCEIKDNGKKLECGTEIIEIEVKGQVPTSGTIGIENNKIEYGNLLLEGTYYHMDATGKKETTQEQKTLEIKDYKGYYADVDNDGKVDGIIYADLAQASPSGAQWENSNGVYNYSAKTDLKDYTISRNKYKANDGFGEKEIISIKPESSGNARFYVMSLEDFIIGAMTSYPEGTYYWYKNAYDKMDSSDTSVDFGTGYENTGKIIEIWNKNGEGEGSYIGATQNDYDIWEHIQTKYQEGWYIPSRGEWAAFADYFTNRTNLETKLIASNYESIYELSRDYWTSSQYDASKSWYVSFNSWKMDSYTVSNIIRTGDYYNPLLTVLYFNRVRLGITF